MAHITPGILHLFCEWNKLGAFTPGWFSWLNLIAHDVCAVVSPNLQVGKHDVCAMWIWVHRWVDMMSVQCESEPKGGLKQVWTAWKRKQEAGPPIYEGGRGATHDLSVRTFCLFSKHVHMLPILECELYSRRTGPRHPRFSCVQFWRLCSTEQKWKYHLNTNERGITWILNVHDTYMGLIETSSLSFSSSKSLCVWRLWRDLHLCRLLWLTPLLSLFSWTSFKH